jgi:Pyruvate/2-oxoacid:ferredoxin oxidoreductase delta subunit
MLHFIARFPKGKNKVLLMNTRAGMLIGNYNLPGITGIAFYLSSLLLILKGYSIKGMVPVDLPSNWISLHPGLNKRTIEILHQKNKKRVLDCADKVLSGGSDFRALREIIQDVLLSPVSVGYYFMGRFMFAKTFYASSDCNNCDLCIRQCPVKAIVKKDSRPYWTFNCESCMHCMSYCPQKAIETAHGFIIGYMVLFSTLSALFFEYFNLFFFKLNQEPAKSIVEMLLFLFLLGFFYRCIHYLMRIKPFERLMVYTSLTKYKFWGRRYKALKDA